MYTNLFFDFDGTLYDTVEGITKCVRYALRKRGMDAPLEELRCFAGPPLTDMFMEKDGFSREEGDRATRDLRAGSMRAAPFRECGSCCRSFAARGSAWR